MLTKPRGQEEERNEAKQRRQRVAADLAGARRSRARSASTTRIARGRIGLGFRPRGGERVRGRLGQAEPVRSNHLGGLTGGPRLSADLFYFLFNCFEPKTFKKNPNLFKNKSRKIPILNKK
jgi:hypothetical protein